MTAPAFARELIARRNNGTPTDSAFIAVGWPTAWLREFVARSPFSRHAVILGTPEPKIYQFGAVVGLSVCVWYERASDAPRAAAIAAHVLAANPLRLFTLNAWTGQSFFHRVAPERRVVV